jgi:hypothetical protein
MGRFLATGYLLLAGIAPAQVAISARSGLVNYIEGTVSLDGAAVTMKPGNFPQMQNGSELRTSEGRAEVLLAPGVFMRLGENSAVRLLSGEIMDTRVEFLAGSVIVETADMSKEQALTFNMTGALLGLLNKGLYRLDGAPPQVSVYDGEAWVTVGGQAQILKRGRRLRLDGVAVAEKFGTKTGDDFFLWAGQRADYLAAANASAAASAQASGFSGTSIWIWEPLYDTYTFLPASGFYNSFWGYRFYPPYVGTPVHPPNGPIHFNPRPPGHPGSGQMSWRDRPAEPGHAGAFGNSGSSKPAGGSAYIDGSSRGSAFGGSGRSGVGGGSTVGGSGRSGVGGGGRGGASGGSAAGGHSSGGGGYSGGGGGGAGHSSGGGGGGYSGGGGGHSGGGGSSSSSGGGSSSSGGSNGGGNAGGGRSR